MGARKREYDGCGSDMTKRLYFASGWPCLPPGDTTFPQSAPKGINSGRKSRRPTYSLLCGNWFVPFQLVDVCAVSLRKDHPNIVAPRIEGGAFLGGVCRTIINSSNASLVAADVIQHGFDDM